MAHIKTIQIRKQEKKKNNPIKAQKNRKFPIKAKKSRKSHI